MVLFILRGTFILLAASVTFLYILVFQEEKVVIGGSGADFGTIIAMVGIASGMMGAVIAIDMVVRRKKLWALSGIFLGLIAGLLAAFALSQVVDLIAILFDPDGTDTAFQNLLEGAKVFIGLITCYLGISLVIQTKDDFRFVIPYVEFAKQIRGNRPTLLDTSVIIDGRILDVIETQFIQGTLVLPNFILDELQVIADSSDKLRRARGRRGLDILQKLQNNEIVDVVIDESDVEGTTVDQKLVTLGQSLQARIMTNDYNLNKIATLRGVNVININDLAQTLQPIVLPGEPMSVKIIKPGEGAGQGVGYLADGTMVVVENSRNLIGSDVDLVVTSMLQTSAGRMIFGRPEGNTEPVADPAPGNASPPPSSSPDPSARPDNHPARSTSRNPRRRQQ